MNKRFLLLFVFGVMNSIWLYGAENIFVNEAEKRQLHEIQYNFSNDIDLNVQDSGTGRTALMNAVRKQNTEVIIQLLNAGANLILTDNEGSTAWDFLRCWMYEEEQDEVTFIDIVKQFIAKGVNINAKDTWERTTLLGSEVKNGRCYRSRRASLIQRLIGLGADPHIRYGYSRTPLMVLSDDKGFYPEYMQALIDGGADLYAKDDKGCMAIDIAGTFEIKAFLQKAMRVKGMKLMCFGQKDKNSSLSTLHTDVLKCIHEQWKVLDEAEINKRKRDEEILLK